MRDLSRELDEVYATAIQAGLADPSRRDLLLAWLPTGLTTGLPVRPSPADQLRSDLQALLQHELTYRTPALTTWLENAERLTDYLPGVPSVFAAMRRTLNAALLDTSGDASPPPSRPASPPQAGPAPVLGIQFLSARPATTGALGLGIELRAIREKLQAGLYRDRLRLGEVEGAVRLTAIEELIRRSEAAILHVSAHGNRDGHLQLEGDGGAPAEIGPRQFRRVIDLVNSDRAADRLIQLVILNACNSAAVAEELVTGTVRYAVGTTEEVHDDAAIAFASGFYSALADSKSIQYAFDSGCLQIDLLPPHLRRYEQAFKLFCAPDTDPKRSFLAPR